MLDYGNTRNLLKSADRINSEHLVIAEWNMNRYYEINQYGVYENPVTASTTVIYESSSSQVLDGANYLLYDDGTTKLSPDQDYFSSLSSIFKPNRPDPGIVLLQKYGSNLMIGNSDNIKIENINADSPRYYPYSYSRPYDYFNSAKIMKTSTSVIGGVVQDNGTILAANPFVVYSDSIPTNKITIKVQNHNTAPDHFAIQYLTSGSWITAVSVREDGGASAYFSDGICNIYYNNGVWSKTVNRVTDLNQLTASTPTQLKNIEGIRLLVFKMKPIPHPITRSNPPRTVTYKNPGGLEIIEMSARLEMDVSQYVESFSFNSSIGDSTNIGLPVGSVVSSTGQVGLSNEENQFLFSSTMNDLGMLNPDVEFTFYQIIRDATVTASVIPLKTMYSNEWNVGEDYSVSVSIEDGMKFLRTTPAPDLFLKGYGEGNKLSYIILTLLDNSGITGFEFKKSSSQYSGAEDIKIRNFFCKKEQTVAEVLEQLAISTQCSIFYDAVGKLNVLTKERLTEKVDLTASTSETSGGTDFWAVFNENYTGQAESSYLTGYNANVMTYSETKLNPITDGDISYHSYGPRKVPGVNNLPENVLNQLTQDFPAAALAFSNYTYATKILWTPGQDNSSVLGAANLIVDLNNKRLADVFDGMYFTALNEEEAIRSIYQITNNTASFGGSAESALEARESLIMYIDRNEGYTIPDYQGTVLIDKEYINYRGKLFSLSASGYSGARIIFSEEEFQETIRFMPKNSSIALLGLVVDVNLKVVSKGGAQYTYKVLSDGRAKLGSDVAKHYAFVENSDDIDPSKTFKLSFGQPKNYSVPGNISATTRFNFMDTNKYKSAKNALGNISYLSLQSYLGFLKLSGPKSPAEDIALIEALDNGENVAGALEKMNNAVDDAVPGDSFDPYVYMQGERNVYGQYINIDFIPNTISTRMRLFSSTKKRKNGEYIMSTNSSIAGIGFGLNANNEGYFLEVESVGSGKDSVAKKAYKNNLRFYKISINKDGKYEPKLLITAPVGAYTVSNTEVQVLKNTNTADPVFELEIRIEKYDNGMKYEVFYGDRSLGTYIEPIAEAIAVNGTRIFMFVRNDSEAIYEYITAAARPSTSAKKGGYFKSANKLDQKIQSGVIPVNKDYMFKDGTVKYYFNDFARLVRQVKEYETRFEAPAFSSALIDVSRVNPQYMIKKYEPTPFGAKIIAANTSSGPITLGEESSLPLYVVGIGMEELGSGSIKMKEYFDNIDEKKRTVTDRERNIAIYGEQSFNLDSQYVQTISQAKNLMKWVVKYCSRQRLKMSMEIYPNPLLELGDKVRIYDSTRGYTINNANFGDRVFVISSIAHSITGSGPAMTIEIIEVGA